jgi:hypothetical protein
MNLSFDKTALPFFWSLPPWFLGGFVLGWFFVLEFGVCSGCGWNRLLEA